MSRQLKLLSNPFSLFLPSEGRRALCFLPSLDHFNISATDNVVCTKGVCADYAYRRWVIFTHLWYAL